MVLEGKVATTNDAGSIPATTARQSFTITKQGGTYKENYRFAHIEVSCVADFENGKLHIYCSRGEDWHGTLDEYTNYDGDMRAFAKSKVIDN